MPNKNSASPLNYLEELLGFDSRDWSLNSKDAWMYGIICGWGDAIEDVAKKHSWTNDQVDQLKDLHFKWNGLKHIGESSSDLKAVFIGEYFFEEETIDPETEEEIYVKQYVPWTVMKDIFKDMCSYVKKRKLSDYER
jgi:hypothetical protein